MVRERCRALGRSSDDEVVTVRRRRRERVEEGGGGRGGTGGRRRESPEIPRMESRGGTGQPDRAASLVGCTEGRQLPAGLPPPRIIRDEGGKETERDRARDI